MKFPREAPKRKVIKALQLIEDLKKENNKLGQRIEALEGE